jgi:WD40 repeat protein
MKFSHEALAGTLAITLLVVVGVWYAQDPDGQHWPLSYLSAGPEKDPKPQCTINGISWSVDGTNLLSAIRGGATSELRLALHHLAGQGTRTPIDATDDVMTAAVLAADGHHVLIGSGQGRLWWLDTDSSESPSVLVDLAGHKSFFTAVAIAPDGRRVAGGTNDGTVYFYLCDPVCRPSVQLMARGRHSFASLQFARDGKRLVGSQRNGRIVVWDLVSGELLQEIAGHQAPASAAEITPDGKRVISAGLDDTVRIWDIATGRELWRGEFGQNGVRALAVSPDGRTAAWGGFHRKIIVWDLDRQEKQFEIAAIATSIHHLQFSPDGATLAAGGAGEFIFLYDAQSGAELRRIEAASPERP